MARWVWQVRVTCRWDRAGDGWQRLQLRACASVVAGGNDIGWITFFLGKRSLLLMSTWIYSQS